ncbi:cutinase family protein [Dietzia sp. CQ4]|uniref:cutinase family protein n=1 Tax=Dietzia sp. (strain CQ4) TaxID=370437 RepID=UPI0015F930FE|nr:cutinase family protein [Dietzia sp. CQ4]MBB1033321.1 cutinase family protein [Dietzia sp. CQ4]
MSLLERLSHPAVTMTAAVAIAASLVAPSALAQNNGSNRCPDNLIIAFPGTGETNENADPYAQIGMLSHVTKPLTATGRAQAFYVPYPAVAVDPSSGMTYAQSKKIGIENATREMEARMNECPNTVFSLTGYSQGADAAGDLAAAIGHGHSSIPADRITSVALLADPGQSPGDSAIAAPASTGFAGARGGLGALQDKASWVCNPDDIYCNTPADKPALAMLGKLGANLDLSDPVRSMTAVVNAVSTTAQPAAVDDAQPPADVNLGPETHSGSDPAPVHAAPVLSTEELIRETEATVRPATPGGVNANAVPQQAGGNNLLTQLLGSVQQAARSGDPATAERQLTKTKTQFESIGLNLSNVGIGGELGPILDELNVIFQTLLNGDLLGVAIKVAHLVPRVIAFASHVATSIGQIVSKLPVAEFAQLAATTAAITAAVSTQNYIALPPLIGTWVGQASNVGSKVAQSGALQELPGLAQTVLGLPKDGVLGQAVDFASFLASGAHTNYASQPLASGRTGTQEISDFIGQQLA